MIHPLVLIHYGQWASPKISVLCCKIVLQLFASTKYVNRFFFLIPLRPEILPKALKLAKLQVLFFACDHWSSQEPLLLSDGKRKWLRIVHSLTNDGNDDIIFTFCFELEDDIVSETARRIEQTLQKKVTLTTPDGELLTNEYIRAGAEATVVAFSE